MSVIIFILKLLGILLLAVIGILLLLLILLLFYPIGYRIEGVSEEKIKLKATFHWLFHVIALHLDFNGDDTDICFRICGVRIRKKEKEREQEKEDTASYDTEEGAHEEYDRSETAPSVLSAASLDAAEQKEPTETAASPFDAAEEEKHGFRFWQKIKGLPVKVKEFLHHVQKTVYAIIHKAANIKEQLFDKANQMAFSYIWKELVYLLKHMRFRRLKTELDFSLKDPAATGWALGIISLFPALYRYDVHIYPDFMAEKVYIRGTFQIKGHFRLLHLFISGIRLLTKKECRALAKRIL